MMDLDFEELYQQSISDPAKFWDQCAKDVIWNKPYTSALEQKESIHPNWFVGGEINMSYNCLDRQVEEGYGDDIAVIFESPMAKTIKKITYRELLESVELLAGMMMQRCGLVKGDRVMLYLPIIPECLVGMLACTRIGAIHTIIYTGFGLKELVRKIKHFEPKLIITSNVGISSSGYVDIKYKVDLAIEQCDYSPDFCMVYNFPNHEKAKMNDAIDLDFYEEILKAKPQGPIPLESSYPMFVNYTSGTTGDPKGVVIETGGAVVSYKYHMKYLFGVKPYETFFAMSSFSWILGQSILSYGPLMSRNPTVLFEGNAETRNDFLEIIRIINDHKIVSFMTTPTVIRFMMKVCKDEDFQFKSKIFKGIHLGGEPLYSSAINWIKKSFKCPVYDIWGQTELGGTAISPCIGHSRSPEQHLDNIKSSLMPGLNGKIVDNDSGLEVLNGTVGKFLLKLPLTPSRASTMFRDDKRFCDIYFKNNPGYYDTMDCAVAFGNQVKVISRNDNTINVEGSRINGYTVEEACLVDERLEQVSIVALEDSLRGFLPFGFFVPRNKDFDEKDLLEKAAKNVRDVYGDLACFEKAVVVPQLPKNKGGKILRISLERMLNGTEAKIPAMINNPEIYPIIFDILCRAGYHPRLPTAP